VITHNPATQDGGCFSSYYDGANKLIGMLVSENATVVSLTRNNVLRHRYSEFVTAARESGSSFVKWEAAGKDVVIEVVKGACEMLAIQSAAKQCTINGHQHILYEDFANNPLRVVEQVLQRAHLKDGVTVKGLLETHHNSLSKKMDELAFAGSFAYAFERPEEVFKSLQAVCLDWTFWGGSFTFTREPRPMCLSAPSCEKAGLTCFCEDTDKMRIAVWLGQNQSQPNWWLEQTPHLSSRSVESIDNKLDKPVVKPDKENVTTSQSPAKSSQSPWPSSAPMSLANGAARLGCSTRWLVRDMA